jgi:hypothetical protein
MVENSRSGFSIEPFVLLATPLEPFVILLGSMKELVLTLGLLFS